MFKLFANIFDRDDANKSRLPESLIKDAIERAVDGTDPRVRAVPGYARTLKRSVIHAVEYVIQLVDSLPEPVPLTHAARQDHPVLGALFYSAARLDEIVGRDAELLKFCRTQRPVPAAVTALLVAEKTEKHGFGFGLLNDRLVKDVAQTTISFDQHRLLEPAASETETRRLLKRRAFDIVLSTALSQVTERKEERSALAERKRLLRCKLAILDRHGSFSNPAEAAEQAQLQARLDAIEQQLSALGPSGSVLPGTLATVAQVLGEAERHVWLEESLLCLDLRYILHARPSPAAPQIAFREVHDSAARQSTVQMVTIPGELLPAGA